MEKIDIRKIASTHNATYQNENIALIDNITDFNNIDNVLLMELYTVIMVVEGHIELTINDQKREIGKGEIFICTPHNLLRDVMFSMGVELRAMFITPQFATLVAEGLDISWYSLITSYEILKAQPHEQAMILKAYELLNSIHHAPQSKNLNKIILNLIHCLVYVIEDVMESNENRVSQTKYSSAETTVKKFIKTLEQSSRKRLTVNEYASLMNISPKYFSHICKKVTGKTAGQLVNEAIMNEAVVLLHNDHYNIKQIADKLGFNNQSHFGNFFRKQKGISPQKYREGR